MDEINSSMPLPRCDCPPLASRLPTTDDSILELPAWSPTLPGALLLQPHTPALWVAVASFLPSPMPCLRLPTLAFLLPSGPRVASQTSTSDLITLTLRKCYPLCCSEVQIPIPTRQPCRTWSRSICPAWPHPFPLSNSSRL